MKIRRDWDTILTNKLDTTGLPDQTFEVTIRDCPYQVTVGPNGHTQEVKKQRRTRSGKVHFHLIWPGHGDPSTDTRKAMKEAETLFEETEQGRVWERVELRRAVTVMASRIKQAVANFATVVEALVTAADAFDEPPWISFAALVDDLASLPGTIEVQRRAWNELMERVEETVQEPEE